MWNINTPPPLPQYLLSNLSQRPGHTGGLPDSQSPRPWINSTVTDPFQILLNQYHHHLNLNYKSQWVYYSDFVTSSQPFPSTSSIVKISKINFTASSFQPFLLSLGGWCQLFNSWLFSWWHWVYLHTAIAELFRTRLTHGCTESERIKFSVCSMYK